MQSILCQLNTCLKVQSLAASCKYLINEVCKVFGGLGPLSSHDLASAEPRLGPEAMAAVTDTAPVTQLPLLTAPLNTSH